jgi:hypothetical protein
MSGIDATVVEEIALAVGALEPVLQNAVVDLIKLFTGPVPSEAQAVAAARAASDAALKALRVAEGRPV